MVLTVISILSSDVMAAAFAIKGTNIETFVTSSLFYSIHQVIHYPGSIEISTGG